MASSIRKPMTDAQKAASRQRIATTLGREYRGYKPGGDPRAAAQAVRDAALKAPPTPPAASPAPLAPPPKLSMPALGGAPAGGMGGAGGTQQMIKNGGMTKKSGRDGCAIRGKTRA